MENTGWQFYFKNQIKDAEKLYSKEATEVSFLLFCLRAKMLAPADYLNWARNFYLVPVLHSEFFLSNPPGPAVFQKFKGLARWSRECLPVAEWDGIPIVACLEVPTNPNYPAIFVLASYDNLEATWQVYESSGKAGTDNHSEISFAATVIAPSLDKNIFGPDGELLLQDEEASPLESENPEGNEESAEEGEADAENSEEIPDGLFGDSITSSAAAPKLSFEGLAAKKPEPPPDIPEIAVSSESVVADIPIENGPAEPLSPMYEEPIRKGPRTARPVLDTLPLDDDEPVTSVGEVAVPHTPPPGAPLKIPQTSLGATGAYFMEKLRRQNQETFDKEVLSCFNQCKTFFKKTMLLAIGDKDRVLKPIMWEGGDYEVRKPTVVEFNLKTPSIFRVVSGTQKPYHGYVVANDLNESFFESWNYGQIPDHVTIIPLIDHDMVVGMLMGFGEKSCYNKNVLQFSENAAKDLTHKLFKPVAKAA